MSLAFAGDRKPFALSMAEFCREVGLCRGSVTPLIASGQIKASRVGKRILIPASEVEALLERNVIKPSES
jgi:excisionase family DNA binding protein